MKSKIKQLNYYVREFSTLNSGNTFVFTDMQDEPQNSIQIKTDNKGYVRLSDGCFFKIDKEGAEVIKVWPEDSVDVIFVAELAD